MANYDITQNFQGVVDFTPTARERKIIISKDSIPNISDIKLEFFSSPTSDSLTPAQLHTGLDDLRFYINGTDFTPELKMRLAERLLKLDAETLERRYLEGFDAYSRTADALRVEVEQRKNDVSYVKAVIDEGNWKQVLGRLGDRRHAGWSGNAHIINFIYNWVPIEPISVLELIEDRDKIPNLQNWLQSEGKHFLNFTFSAGSAPSFEEIDRKFWPAGRLSYSVSTISINPLEPVLKELLFKIREVSDLSEILRLRYMEPLKNDLDTLQGEFETGQASMAASIDELRRLLEKQSN